MTANIPLMRRELHRALIECWAQGRIAIKGRHVSRDTFIAEADQVAQRYKVQLDIKEVDGKLYAMANEGLPLKIGRDHSQRELHKKVNPHYLANRTTWAQLGHPSRGL